MSFFNKLKDRLFKSSSKLDEGLDAIVAADAAPEAAEAPLTVAEVPTPQPPAPQLPRQDPTPETRKPGLMGRIFGAETEKTLKDLSTRLGGALE